MEEDKEFGFGHSNKRFILKIIIKVFLVKTIITTKIKNKVYNLIFISLGEGLRIIKNSWAIICLVEYKSKTFKSQ